MKVLIALYLGIILSTPIFAGGKITLASTVYQMLHSPAGSGKFVIQMGYLFRKPPQFFKPLHVADYHTIFGLRPTLASEVEALLAKEYGIYLNIDENTLEEEKHPWTKDGVTAAKKIGETKDGGDLMRIIFYPDGSFNPRYTEDMDGLAHFADVYFHGKMEAAYDEVHVWLKTSPINNRITMPSAWNHFVGSTEKYYHIKQVLGDFFFNIFAHIDNKILLPLKDEPFSNIAYVLIANYEFYKLKVHPQNFFAGLEGNLKRLARAHIRINLLDRKGRLVQTKYKYASGLQLLAHHYFWGDTEKAYFLISNHERELFEKLEWPEPEEIKPAPTETQPLTYAGEPRAENVGFGLDEYRFNVRNRLWIQYFNAKRTRMPRRFDTKKEMSLKEIEELIKMEPPLGERLPGKEAPYLIYALAEIHEAASFNESWLDPAEAVTLIKKFSDNIDHNFPKKDVLNIYQRMINTLMVLEPHEIFDIIEKLDRYIKQAFPSGMFTDPATEDLHVEGIQGWILGEVLFRLNDTARFAQRASDSNKMALSLAISKMRHEEMIVPFMAEVARQGIELEAWAILMREMYGHNWPHSMKGHITILAQDPLIPEEYRAIANIVLAEGSESTATQRVLQEN